MSSFELLVEKFLTENICHLTLVDALVPEVATWIDKSMKINVSDHGSVTENLLRCLAGGAHSGHCTSDG